MLQKIIQKKNNTKNSSLNDVLDRLTNHNFNCSFNEDNIYDTDDSIVNYTETKDYMKLALQIKDI